MNFYKHYMGDYDRKTAHLSLAEHGAYLILLHHYYSTGEALPASLPTLCRICRATTESETDTVSRVVNEFFYLNGDGKRHNSRADQELARWNEQAKTNREIGKLGGRPRKQSITESETEPITEQKPSPEVRNQKLEVRSQNPENTKSKTKAQPAKIDLPEWVPLDQWNAWIEARTKRRNAPTAWALRLAIIKLEHLRDAGYSPARILANSAFNGWAGLFAPKD